MGATFAQGVRVGSRLRMNFSVVSYNIHRCVGSDARKDPDRIADMLRTLSGDIVGLQEVESHGPPGGNAHQLDYLARVGGYESIAGPTMMQPAGDYGNALLTSGRVLDVRRHAFPTTRGEPRGLLEASIEIHGRPVRTMVTHLGLHPTERRKQVAKILAIVGPETEMPIILLGDFNEWIPWARSRRQLRERFGRISTPATFPSKRPMFALDHIWVQPVRVLESLEAVRTPLSRVASDHLPLRAVVSLESVQS